MNEFKSCRPRQSDPKACLLDDHLSTFLMAFLPRLPTLYIQVEPGAKPEMQVLLGSEILGQKQNGKETWGGRGEGKIKSS